MNKKSQITIFVIIAVIIVVVIAAFFILKEKTAQQTEVYVSPDIQPVYDFVKSCIKITGENALQFIGLHGGYAFLPSDVPMVESRIPYYVHSGKSYILSKSLVENQIDSYITRELPVCINNFKDLPNFEITSSNITMNTSINLNEVIFNVQYLITIKKGVSTYQLEDFSGNKVLVRLGLILNLTDSIVADQLNHTNSLALSYLDALGKESNLRIDTTNYGNDSVIFNISDSVSKINNSNYEFLFANQYT